MVNNWGRGRRRGNKGIKIKGEDAGSRRGGGKQSRV